MREPARVRVGVHAGSGPAACAAALERAVRRTLASAGCRRGEISVALLDDVEITELNRRYLRKDRPTDVLAFSLGEPGDVVGDVYIGFEQAARQAENLGVATCEELVRLAVHGTLHVLGHDHPEGPERDTSEMFRLQERIVRESMEALDGG